MYNDKELITTLTSQLEPEQVRKYLVIHNFLIEKDSETYNESLTNILNIDELDRDPLSTIDELMYSLKVGLYEILYKRGIIIDKDMLTLDLMEDIVIALIGLSNVSPIDAKLILDTISDLDDSEDIIVNILVYFNGLLNVDRLHLIIETVYGVTVDKIKKYLQQLVDQYDNGDTSIDIEDSMRIANFLTRSITKLTSIGFNNLPNSLLFLVNNGLKLKDLAVADYKNVMSELNFIVKELDKSNTSITYLISMLDYVILDVITINIVKGYQLADIISSIKDIVHSSITDNIKRHKISEHVDSIINDIINVGYVTLIEKELEEEQKE